MPHSIDIFPRAMADIRATVSWLSQKSLATASRWHERLLGTIRSLADNPNRCPLANEAVDLGVELRELLVGRRPHVHRVLFTIDGEKVNILRVRHAARDRLSSDDI